MQGSITGGSNRDMGTFIRAVTGFVVALTLLHGTAFWSGLKGPSIQQVQADIKAERPGNRIEASLNELLAPQKGTITTPSARETRARGLQF
jgi:hypothetical protein